MSDLEIPKGTTWAAEWPVLDDAGAAVNVTGWSVEAQVRPTVESNTVHHEWSTTEGNAEAGDGFVRILVDHAESVDWDWSSGVYDVMLTSLEDERTELDSGSVTVRATVTRDVAD